VSDKAESPTSLIPRLPKVELHLHLEGSIRRATLEEFSRSKRWLRERIANWIAERERESYRYQNFQHFLKSFALVALLLERPEDYALVTSKLIDELADQNVKYAEVTLSAGVILWKQQPIEPVFEAICQAEEEGERRRAVRLRWIFDAVRQFGAEHAREVLGWAGRLRSRGVVAFGIGGDEARGPAAQFADVYREARDLGLRVTAHAGETAGPESILAAVEILGAERIGHGLTILRDPRVVDLVRERRIPLEVCPTSNVATGLLRRFEDHPLKDFLAAGLIVTLNSDDPGLFDTSLERELQLAASSFALSIEQLVALSENAIHAAFLPQAEQDQLVKSLHAAAKLHV